MEWRAPLRWLLYRSLMGLSPRYCVEGVEVIDASGGHDQLAIQRLEEALELIRDTDPRRHHRLKKDIKRFILVKAGGPEYAHEVQACVLRSAYVRNAEAAAVATTIVHEAMHARLCARRVGYGMGIRARVEEVCTREQIAFVKRLGRDDILVQLEEKLKRPWWTESELRSRRTDALRDLGFS